jgi:biopolymer transport protein ExbB/TolQ
MKNSFSTEFVFQLFSLIVAIIIVHTIYVGVIRPNAAAILEEQRVMMAEDPGYVAERSGYVIVKDFEQEACFILMIWALSIMGYKAWAANRERALSALDLVPVADGVRILPDDSREYARQLQGMPEEQRLLLLPRVLLAALERFGATRNIQDVSSTTHTIVTSEAERLESELSMIRYIAWAIPSIGFIGTVRGIGAALGLAHQAVEGDISGVTQNLGTAFNSTFIALLISIFLMFLVHQLQLLQERLAFEAESYVDQHLIRHMRVK